MSLEADIKLLFIDHRVAVLLCYFNNERQWWKIRTNDFKNFRFKVQRFRINSCHFKGDDPPDFELLVLEFLSIEKSVWSLQFNVVTLYLYPCLFIGLWLGLGTHTSNRRNIKKQFSISIRVWQSIVLLMFWRSVNRCGGSLFPFMTQLESSVFITQSKSWFMLVSKQWRTYDVKFVSLPTLQSPLHCSLTQTSPEV